MSSEHKGPKRYTEDSKVSDLLLPQELVSQAQQEQRADINLAFTRIEFNFARLGLGEVGVARYFDFPLDSSRERKLLIARTYERTGRNVLRAYINDEIPHPHPALDDIRRLHMSAFALRTEDKRVIRYRSSADRLVAEGTWWATGELFVGPFIFHDRQLEVVELRGKTSHTLPQLPMTHRNYTPEERLHRVENIEYLATILDSVTPEVAVEDVTIFLPPAAKLGA